MTNVNINKTKVSEKIKCLLEDMIYTRMRPGDKLPSEQALTELFQTSRSSVREAIQALEGSGVVERRSRAAYVASSADECFVEPLNILVRLEEAGIKDIIEIRKIFETEAAGHAAQRATKEQLTELENLIWLMQKPDLTIEEYYSLDTRYHQLIAEASGNAAIRQFIHDLHIVLTKLYPRFCTLEIVNNSALPVQIALVKAIREGDVKTARQCMAEHLSESEGIFEQGQGGE